MKVCGIIAEYDPFHRGHLYHLGKAREISGADYMVCVLGSAFSQRGEAMMFGTHARARMALANGFDLVLGMPVDCSCAQANRFAMGGVHILDALGVVTHLSFGSESADTGLLSAAADCLNRPGLKFAETLRRELHAGHSFAAAQGKALRAALPNLTEQLAASPNFILGVSYLRELQRLGSGILPLPVERTTAYHSLRAGGAASASAVRAILLQTPDADLGAECPRASLDVMRGAPRHRPEALDKALLALLTGPYARASLRGAEISEGLEERIHAAARSAASREELLSLVKTRRYPRARISRALTQALLGLHGEPRRPAYARLLGFRPGAKELLREISRHGFPLVTRPARENYPGLAQDMRAEELWRIGASLGAATAWKERVIILNEHEVPEVE